MVTIRNDIDSSGHTNGSPVSVDGVKNVNHLANGSRRPTIGEIKPKAFNRRCVSFLALIVCVAVCFGVGMLFLYGHLVDRLNESTSQGVLLHDDHEQPTILLAPKSAMSTTTISSKPALMEEEEEAEQQLVSDNGGTSPVMWIDSSAPKESVNSAETSTQINTERSNESAQQSNGGSVLPQDGSFDDEEDEDTGSGQSTDEKGSLDHM
uniref:Uncharacterized protein n=1 Tax=Anopheles braziliensis TaxID=58242 RepID=A0A2M3ZKQ7_9DIPT